MTDMSEKVQLTRFRGKCAVGGILCPCEEPLFFGILPIREMNKAGNGLQARV